MFKKIAVQGLRLFVCITGPHYHALLHGKVRENITLLSKQDFKNKHVYVIGSGPSVANLSLIPKDVVVCCCNFSLNYVPKNVPVMYHMTTEHAYTNNTLIKDLIEEHPIERILINNTSLLSEDNRTQLYYPKDTSIFSSFIDTGKLNSLRLTLFKKGQVHFFSSGINLVGIALLGGASRVSVIGVEASQENSYSDANSYKSDPRHKLNAHQYADSFFLEQCVEKKLPVFALDPDSSIAQIIPTKK